MNALLHFVLGGSRSGKSRRAEELARQSSLPVVYIATCATALADPEMRTRIEQHRERRPAEWKTIENRFDLKNLVVEHEGALLLLDCLTLWLSFRQMTAKDSEIISELEETLRRARELERSLIIVSNEIGTGLVPASAEARRFRDLAGTVNQLVASQATRVELMVAGLPLILKGEARP